MLAFLPDGYATKTSADGPWLERTGPRARLVEVLTTSPTSGNQRTDPALGAIRALVAASPAPMAVFDDAGSCLIANRAFVLHAAHPGAAQCETKSAFTPDGGPTLTLVTASMSTRPPDDGSFSAALLFDTVINALPIMFNAKDTDSRYLFMNRYQAGLYGVNAQDAIGRTAEELLGADYGGYTRGRDAQVLRTGQPSGFYEESYAAADGKIRHWLTNKVPLAARDGPIWGVATVAIDMTERAALQESLRQANAQTEAANRVKSGFLTAMSHELRTPLNAVIGFAEILHEQVISATDAPESREYAGYILNSGRELLALINDILDFARVESGTLKLNRAPVDLAAVVVNVIEVLSNAARDAKVTLIHDVSLPTVTMHADAMRLRQALLNIVGNAVKFTPAGGHVVVVLRHGVDGRAVITVSDSGIGIDKAQIAHVFEPFWQADSGLARMHHGTGIGLPLARQLITLHGGSVELQSRLGEGTWVTVTLPTA